MMDDNNNLQLTSAVNSLSTASCTTDHWRLCVSKYTSKHSFKAVCKSYFIDTSMEPAFNLFAASFILDKQISTATSVIYIMRITVIDKGDDLMKNITKKHLSRA